MFGVRGTQVLPVDLLGVVREDLRAALAASGEAERAGLEAALRIVEGYSSADLRRRWVGGILARAEVDPQAESVKAVKALRDAAPGLALKDAVALVQETASQDPPA